MPDSPSIRIVRYRRREAVARDRHSRTLGVLHVRTDDNTRGQVRRRTVLKGAAWSVPVVAAAVAVPARAASVVCEDCEDYAVSQVLEKQNGAWQYRDTVTVTHCGEPIPVVGVTVILDFDDPEDYEHGTNGDGTSTSYNEETGELTVQGTGTGESMYFSGAIGHGNDAAKTVTGTISVAVPGCDGFVITGQPFSVETVKN
jgi:hypothetical protein